MAHAQGHDGWPALMQTMWWADHKSAGPQAYPAARALPPPARERMKIRGSPETAINIQPADIKFNTGALRPRDRDINPALMITTLTGG